MSAGRIVVVDDTSINRILLTEMLTAADYEVEAAASGEQALAAIARGRPELILLDVQMPGMSGYEVCAQLKHDARWRAIPVVFISALDDVAEKVRGFEAGGVDFVTKPFEPAEVLARVGSQVKLYRLQQELKQRNLELLRRNEQLVLAQERTEQIFFALSEALAGTTIDDTYQLETKIGEGGFGAVYRGTHLRLRRPVAVKVLRPRADSGGEDLARFRREGIAACRINHQNAVEVLDFGVSSAGIAYLVMELLTGRTLAALLTEERVLPVKRCAEVAAPVCDALVAAHAAGIVHRDIKPQNIFLHHDGSREIVKVVDFGIARLLDQPSGLDGDGLTKQGSLVGTPEYIAPERLFGRPYDDRSDIYSVGVMLYSMLAGNLPYPLPAAAGFGEMVRLHVEGKPRNLAEVARPNVPRLVADTVMRALDADPAMRPTLAEIAGVLRSA
jgi:DNA-binding response OmpR family regulator